MTINVATDARVASERVLYEIEMFCLIATYFETGVVDDAVRGLQHEGLVVRNALIEAFQPHARQLIDLLTGKDSRDMPASDFTTSTWRQLERSQWRRPDFERFSQRVMHLSLKRAESSPRPSSEWTVGASAATSARTSDGFSCRR